MSNAAVVAGLSREITAVAEGVNRVDARQTDVATRRALRAAHGALADAQFHLATAHRLGLDPAIDARVLEATA